MIWIKLIEINWNKIITFNIGAKKILNELI